MIVAMLSSGTMGVWAQDQVEAHLGADIDYWNDGDDQPYFTIRGLTRATHSKDSSTTISVP